jgi:hypothetical protein
MASLLLRTDKVGEQRICIKKVCHCERSPEPILVQGDAKQSDTFEKAADEVGGNLLFQYNTTP